MLLSRLTLTLPALIFLSSAAYAQIPTAAPTEPSSQYGWLEGTITNSDGQVISETPFNEGKHIKGVRQGGGQFDADTDPKLGGLYSVRDIRPGVYDIILTKGHIGYNATYSPERIFGVVVKPGERTVLRIVMDQGDTYEEVGKPAVVSAPATNVTDELAKMQKQIDDLKQQVAALLKTTAAAGTPAATTKP